MHLQESGEMYLETIYILSKTGKAVRSIDVGEYMGYSKPSVSRAVGLLKQGGYVVADADGFLSLTDEGKRVAEKINEIFLAEWGCPPQAITISHETVQPDDWVETVVKPEIEPKADKMLIRSGEKKY